MEVMMQSTKTCQRIGVSIAIMVSCFPLIAVAQESNFGKLALNQTQSSGVLRGTTGGSASLPGIVSNRDRNNRKCLGYGDPKPDHLLVLEKPFATLTLKVRSNTDTTLVVQGPDGVVRCGDDTGSSKDAVITDSDWGPGTYRVWVGTANPGVQHDYILTVQP